MQKARRRLQRKSDLIQAFIREADYISNIIDQAMLIMDSIPDIGGRDQRLEG